MRNVAGLLRGSDPVLGHQYVFVTAHYDHLGKNAKGIFPGANDDGSGTVSVMEIAAALAAMNPHPRRSIVFMTVFGEEEGLLGSYYYASIRSSPCGTPLPISISNRWAGRMISAAPMSAECS